MSTVLQSNGLLNSSPASEYATANDVQKLFASEMTELFHLALLLTANVNKAESCVIWAMHECMASNSVRKAWLPVWSRNAIMRQGARLVTGSQGYSLVRIPNAYRVAADDEWPRIAVNTDLDSAGILELSDFDRLVYVICILEHYPARDCANLVGRPLEEVLVAQKRSLAQIAAIESEWRRESACEQPAREQSDFLGSRGNLVA